MLPMVSPTPIVTRASIARKTRSVVVIVSPEFARTTTPTTPITSGVRQMRVGSRYCQVACR